MSVLEEILAWSQDRPMVVRDALRRIVIRGNLDDRDIDELTRICKAQRGLVDQDNLAPEPEPLAAENLPTSSSPTESTKLIAIRDVQHVNALASDQHLGFGLEGMTIIFGDNGSGKSGYARILRRVCRAWSRGDRILANVFNEETSEAASAIIDFQVGDSTRSSA